MTPVPPGTPSPIGDPSRLQPQMPLAAFGAAACWGPLGIQTLNEASPAGTGHFCPPLGPCHLLLTDTETWGLFQKTKQPLGQQNP